MIRSIRPRSSCLAWPFLVVTVSLAAGLSGCRKPAPRGPDGKPVFVGNGFRHPAGEPFFCFEYTNDKGGRASMCREIVEWCAQSLKKKNDAGVSILSECKAQDQVACFEVDGHATHCFMTTEECAATKTVKWADSGYATECKTLDRSFQPTG